MPGTSAAHTIWFIAAVLVAAVLAGAVVGITFSISKGLENKGSQVEGALSTKIKIINDPKNVPFYQSTNTVTFYVENLGYSVLNKNPSSIVVLINGMVAQPSTVTLYSGAPTWKTSEVAIINATAPGLSQGQDYTLWISASDVKTGAAATDTMDFNVIVN